MTPPPEKPTKMPQKHHFIQEIASDDGLEVQDIISQMIKHICPDLQTTASNVKKLEETTFQKNVTVQDALVRLLTQYTG